MNKRYALYEERGDLLERKAISEKYTTGWYLQEKLEEINEQIRVIENVTPQAQKTYFEILAEPAIEVTPWDEIPDSDTTPKLPPAGINTLQALADARDKSFNAHYYGNNGLPYFPHQTGGTR